MSRYETQLRKKAVCHTNFMIGIKYKVISEILNGRVVWYMKYISKKLLFKIWCLGGELQIFIT